MDAGTVLCRIYYTREDRAGRSRRHGGGRIPHLRSRRRTSANLILEIVG